MAAFVIGMQVGTNEVHVQITTSSSKSSHSETSSKASLLKPNTRQHVTEVSHFVMSG